MKLTIQIWVAAGLFLAVSALVQADTHNKVLSGGIQESAPSSCQRRQMAELEAKDFIMKAAKTYCRSEGYGWRAASLKDMGSLDCRPCEANKFSCVYSGATLECRKSERTPLLGWFSGKP